MLMRPTPNLLAPALGSLIRLALALLLGLVVAGFVLLGIGVALLSVLWSLLRGKRPAMFTVFRTFQQASRQFRGAAGPARRPMAAAKGANGTDVVDVQAHEVQPVTPALSTRTEV